MPKVALPIAQKALARWADKVLLSEDKIVVGLPTETDAARRDLVQTLLLALAA
jgi:hypothetical protein